MAEKVMLFSDWLASKTKTKWRYDAEPYVRYLEKILFEKRKFPAFYSADQAKRDFENHLNLFAEMFTEKLNKQNAPAKMGKFVAARVAELEALALEKAKSGGGTGSGTGKGGDKGGNKGGNKGGESESGSGSGGGAGGGKGKKVKGGDSGEGNQIILEKKKPDPYDKKPEYGDMDLRRDLAKMPTNPDLKMKTEAGDEMEDDRRSWGAVRLSGNMEIDLKNMEAFTKGKPGSIWLGFIRIGSRVGQKKDKLVMVELTEEKVVGANEYAFPASQLKSGDEWHSVVLNKKFNETTHKIALWNGIPEKEMKSGKIAFDYNPAGWVERFRMYKAAPTDKQTVKELVKELPVHMTGCFFGFFLVKAADGGKKHYWNFKCASLNKWANGTFLKDGPLKKLSEIDGQERAVYTNMLTQVRNGFGVANDLMKSYEGYVSGFLGVRGDSKLLPLSWATAVIKTLTGGKDEGGNAIKEKSRD